MKLSDVAGDDLGGDPQPKSGRLKLSDIAASSTAAPKADAPPEFDQAGGLMTGPSQKVDTGRIGSAIAPTLRGVAPYAAGAGAGFLAGGPPGAAIGAGAVAATDLLTGLYNPVAKATGLPHAASASEAVNEGLTKLGVPESKTPGARVAQSTAEGITGALSGVGAAAKVGEAVASPLAKKIAGALSEGPGKQAASGALSGASGQAASEAGLGPVGQFIVSLFGGAAPYGKAAITEAGKAAAPGKTVPRSAATEAANAGYVLPPKEMTDTPSQLSNLLSGWGGKVKLQQAASVKNQAVTNELAAKALGLSGDTVLTDQVFSDIRKQAGQKYEAVKKAVPAISAYDANGTTQAYKDFEKTIQGLGGANSQAGQHFPGLMKNQAIADLREALVGPNAPKIIPTEAAIELVKKLRFDATANLKAPGDPSKHALGLAQRQAAEAIDELVESGVSAAGKPDAVKEYREARRLIAKSYDVEGATNPATGDVSAGGLAKLAAKGRPLTDELETIARAAAAHPKSMQSPAQFGGGEAHSVADFFASGLALAHGNPSVAGAVLGRPVARSAVMSKPYQDMAMRRGPMQNALAPASIPALDTYAQSENRSEVMSK